MFVYRNTIQHEGEQCMDKEIHGTVIVTLHWRLFVNDRN